MINNEIKQLVRDMKIETVADTGTFQELESIAAELLNSNDTGNKLLAMRIQARLNENPNYQDFVKRAEIEQEVKEMENDQKIAKQQEIRQVNATANVEHRRREESKSRYEEDKKVTEAFNKLSVEQQKMFLEIEKSFAPEHRQALRNFALTSGTAEEKRQQNVDLLNDVIGKDILEIKNGKVDVKDGTTYDDLSKAIPKQDAITESAIVAQNTTAALEGVQIRTNIGTEQAVMKTQAAEDFIKITGQSVAGSVEDNKVETDRRENTKKTEEFLKELENNETLKRYDEDLSKIKKFGDESEIKAKEQEIAQDFIEKMKKAGIDPNKVDKKVVEEYVEKSGLSQEAKTLLNNTVAKHAQDYSAHDKKLEDSAKNYYEEQSAKRAEEKQTNASKSKEEQLEEIHQSIKSGLAKFNTEQEKDEVVKMAKDLGYNITKDEINDYVAKKQASESSVTTQKAEEKEVKVYDPTVRGQKQTSGVQYEADREVKSTYNPAALHKNEEIYVAVNTANSSSN